VEQGDSGGHVSRRRSGAAGRFALYSMAIVDGGPAIGPPLGGWITDPLELAVDFSSSIFRLGLFSLILTSRLLKDPPEFTREVGKRPRKDGRLKIDVWGKSLSVAIAFCVPGGGAGIAGRTLGLVSRVILSWCSLRWRWRRCCFAIVWGVAASGTRFVENFDCWGDRKLCAGEYFFYFLFRVSRCTDPPC